MQQILLPIIILLIETSLLVNSYAGNVAYERRWVQNTIAQVVTVNLNSPEVVVSPAISRYGVGSTEGFGSMLSRLQPTAAITGTYFCVRTLRPVGDIVVEGKVVHKGSVGTAVCITGKNKVDFIKPALGRANGWQGYRSVLSTGPRLLTNGSITVYPRSEGFKDRALYRKSRRSALGVTRENKLLLVTVNSPVYLSHLARIMRDLGAINAVALDGGSSTALYCKGRVPSHPGRRLTNVLVVYESSKQFAQIRSRLSQLPVVASKPTRS